MFNLGWGEILLIGIVALIAIGPKELPGVLRTVGQMIGKVRRMANEFQGQFQEALREADIADLKKHAEDIVSDVSNFDPLTETQKDLEKSLEFPEAAGAPTTSAADYKPDAAATEALPAPTEQIATLPVIDVPLPDMPAPLTEKDFAVAAAPAGETPAAPAQEASNETGKETSKQAGGKA